MPGKRKKNAQAQALGYLRWKGVSKAEREAELAKARAAKAAKRQPQDDEPLNPWDEV